MKRVLTTLAAAGGLAVLAAGANAQSLGGFPIREPGSKAVGSGAGASAPTQKGLSQIIVDANGPGPYKTITSAVKDIAEGGLIYVMHGIYNETVTLDKSVLIQGDRGPGSGVEVNAPMNAPCLTFQPSQGTAHAVVANVSFYSRIKSSAASCVDVGGGVFTLKESRVAGSTLAPAVRISGGTVVLEKNDISSGTKGVFVEQPHTLSQSFIIDNIIAKNTIGVDIAAGSRADVVIAGNEILDNKYSGVQSSGYGAATLIGNKISNNLGSGIVLDKFAKISLVRFNEIVGNDGDGVTVPFGANGIIEDNEIVGNNNLPIHVGEGMEPKITNNYIRESASKKKKRRR